MTARSVFAQFLLFIGAVLPCLFYRASVANALTIDNFSDPLIVVSTLAAPNNEVVLSTTNAIGGTRAFQTSLTAGDGSRRLTLEAYGGELTHSQESQVIGTSMVVWDGDATAGGVSYAGLGGIDLTQDGGTAIELEVIEFDPGTNGLPIDLVVTLYDSSDPSGARYSSYTHTFTASVLSQTLTMPFASFVSTGGGVDFTSVGAITLFIDGKDSAVDLAISRIGTDGQCPDVPASDGRVIDDCSICVGQAGYDSSKDECGLCPGDTQYQNAKDDCGECFGQNQAQDECGVCYGDGKDICELCPGDTGYGENTCVDCSDTPFGNSVVDSCGVCGGTGPDDCGECPGSELFASNYCLDCNGVPFGQATEKECASCEDFDISDTQRVLDGGAKRQEKLIRKILRRLNRQFGERRGLKRFVAKTRKTAHELQVSNWILSWTMPSIFSLCESSVSFCVQVDNAGTLQSYKDQSLSLKELANTVVRRLAKLKGRAGKPERKYLKNAETLHEENLKLADTVPLVVNSCTES